MVIEMEKYPNVVSKLGKGGQKIRDNILRKFEHLNFCTSGDNQNQVPISDGAL